MQVFVSFAKEQTDDDLLTDVIISNGTAQPNMPAQINPATTQAQAPVTPPQPQQPGRLSDGKPKAGKEKKAKASKVKSDREKSSSSTAMRTLPETKEKPQTRSRNSSGSDSSNCGAQGETSKSHRSKHKAETHPSALFIVGTSTQDSAL